jgi:hypothetical protein
VALGRLLRAAQRERTPLAPRPLLSLRRVRLEGGSAALEALRAPMARDEDDERRGEERRGRARRAAERRIARPNREGGDGEDERQQPRAREEARPRRV